MKTDWEEKIRRKNHYDTFVDIQIYRRCVLSLIVSFCRACLHSPKKGTQTDTHNIVLGEGEMLLFELGS